VFDFFFKLLILIFHISLLSVIIVVCRFVAQLDLTHVPDMIFAENCLRLVHERGFGVEFTTLDALKLVRNAQEQDIVQVADAKAWKEARLVSRTVDFMFEIVSVDNNESDGDSITQWTRYYLLSDEKRSHEL